MQFDLKKKKKKSLSQLNIMEGNLSSRNIMQVNDSYGGFDLQEPIRINHQQTLPPHHQQGSSMALHHTIRDKFPLTIGSNQEDQTLSLADYNKPDNNNNRVKYPSDEDEPSFTEDAPNNKGKQPSSSSSTWHRVKWTDEMVRLLITAVSYITEETAAEYGGGSRRKCANLQKKGKWKSVSKAMAERGHFVSPQQCEDKFNDLNKRYKRLNEILGRGTSCEVVENPSLLDVIDHVSDKGKEEVRKILSSKHLHYEEMCSYHNGNRLHLPPDPDLQRSLRNSLRSRDDCDDNDVKRHHASGEDNDEVDQESELDGRDESEGNQGPLAPKRVKQCHGHEEFSFGNSLKFNFRAENAGSDEGMKTNIMSQKNQQMNHWKLQLEEQRLHIEARMLELEREKFKWQRFSRKKDRELEMMRMEIERMKLENERMALDLRRKEMGIDDV